MNLLNQVTVPASQQGWQCPGCRNILAPNQVFCIFCKPPIQPSPGILGPKALDVLIKAQDVKSG